MNILKQGAMAIHESEAIVYEDVSSHLSAEFNRKTRISAGNFQNLVHFSKMLIKHGIVSFAFISHKALRWLSPFFLLFSLLLIFEQKKITGYITNSQTKRLSTNIGYQRKFATKRVQIVRINILPSTMTLMKPMYLKLSYAI